MSRFEDERVRKLARRIEKVYKQASEELTGKVNSFFGSFEKKDAKMKELFEAGEITKHRWISWRENQMMMGKKWTDLRDTMAERMTEADRIAMRYVNGELPAIYAHNYNQVGYGIERKVKGYSFDLVNENAVRTLSTSNKTLLPYKFVDGHKATRWNTKEVNSQVLQGILQGESAPQIAERLLGVTKMNAASAMRNARTAVTSAQNKGRVDAMKTAEDDGVIMGKEWIATKDERTREAHAELDRVVVKVNEPFENEIGQIMYPGDPDADPANTYNCRCTIAEVVLGFKPKEEELQKEQEFEVVEQESGNHNFYEEFGDAPQREDYMNREFSPEHYYEEQNAARAEYKADLNEYNAKVGEWYDENYGGKTLTEGEFNEWMDNHGVVQYGSLDGVDPEAIAAYTERFDQLTSDFPQVLENHEMSGVPFEIAYNPNAVWNAEATHGFTFGSGMDNFRSQVIDSSNVIKTGMVHGENPVVSIFDHEFGHQLFDAMRQTGLDFDLKTPELVERNIKMERDLVDSLQGLIGMSEYATTNKEELFAEGFAAWYGGEKTDFANAFGDFLERWGVIK